MLLPIWTPDALSSEAKPRSGTAWRVVEAQNRVSTMKLGVTLEEQVILERLIETTKPPLPAECQGLDFLLSTPFRYDPVPPSGSRFRRAGRTPGVFYSAEAVSTAVAEVAFYHLLFYAESPNTPWPANPPEYTAFSILYGTECALDLTAPPFDEFSPIWTHPTSYAACQDFADVARKAGAEVIRYTSVRDPARGNNIALLTAKAFAETAPQSYQTWRMSFGAPGVIALAEFPRQTLEFDPATFQDPRLADMRWVR